MTDLPDAVVEAAARALSQEHVFNCICASLDSEDDICEPCVDAARAALAAASGPWAEQLDAANENNAQVQHGRDHYVRTESLRAELDNLRDRVNALADEWDAQCEMAGSLQFPPWTNDQLRAAIGSDS